MKKDILAFLKKNKLFAPDDVNSLIVSSFLIYNNFTVKFNQLLIKCIDHQIPQKNDLLKGLLSIISCHQKCFDFEDLIQLFEFVISPANRITNGAVYTPQLIRQFIIKETLGRKNNKLNIQTKTADIACGCGAFLIDVAQYMKHTFQLTYKEIYFRNIYGIDIEDYAISRAKLLLSLLALTQGEDDNFSFNLFIGNTLSFNWHANLGDFKGFDFILGNPPYVAARHLSSTTKNLLSRLRTCKTGNPDLYIPFFQIGIENLSHSGVLGFITMNSFFKSLNARELRLFFTEKSLDFKIYDFGAEQVFKSRNTYTCICIIKNKVNKKIRYTRLSPMLLSCKNIELSSIEYKKLAPHKGWNLKNHELIEKIEKTGRPLGELFRTSHGLATLRNNIYIFSSIKEDNDFFYLEMDKKIFPIEKTICCEVINSNKLSRTVSLNQLKEQLIFPYTNEKKPKLINENDFKKKFPKAYAYLEANKIALSERDKGKGKYLTWYAYGRSQGLEQVTYKMFFPKYSDITPHFLINSDKRLYFYNGLAFFGKSIRELTILKKILESKVFWFYIQSTSKPYSSNYYSLNGTYIKNFGICTLTEKEENFILKQNTDTILNEFIAKKYDINLNDLDSK
ncbi:Eco57I restriction-modification methylase domain-containing protein [Gilliamella sp. WF3-4]|uniref:Eco57I restriction-modification methylase domain-containing protein n=1 Tax=Gilliamella sp. WF3-4 TaxID=3120255 RepID=UPI00080E2E30|nr:N-6 DNA methylase [Gilliamella apicola]OCG15127.1 N-6 DNA methylase [Gilliamella apicola]